MDLGDVAAFLYKFLYIEMPCARLMLKQVRELNLLRESNAELREENIKCFEDCRVSYSYSGFCH